VLRYLGTSYEGEPGRSVTLRELTENLNASQHEIGEALAYVNDSVASSSRTSGYPADPDWSVTPSERSLDYPDLNSVMAQVAEWAERDAAAPPFSGFVPFDESVEKPSWIKKHKGLSVVIATGTTAIIAVLANLATIAAFLKTLLGDG
jgi:hypothetical protein